MIVTDLTSDAPAFGYACRIACPFADTSLERIIECTRPRLIRSYTAGSAWQSKFTVAFFNHVNFSHCRQLTRDCSRLTSQIQFEEENTDKNLDTELRRSRLRNNGNSLTTSRWGLTPKILQSCLHRMIAE